MPQISNEDDSIRTEETNSTPEYGINDSTAPESNIRDPTAPVLSLPFPRRLTYGVGHVLNDLCSSMWFSYLLLYLNKVLEFSNQQAGALILVGQVSDGLATPFIGYESDNTKGCFSYGKRKSWHLLGTFCVLLSFPFLFIMCVVCEEATDKYAMFIYYCPLVVIFQFGWAATQISHLSLVPELTRIDGERVELNAIRYAFTVISSITVYLVTWALLNSDLNQVLTPEDSSKFRTLVLIIVGIGIPFTVIFHIGTRESNDHDSVPGSESVPGLEGSNSALDESIDRRANNPMTWRLWWSEPQFYLVGLLYMSTRLVVNISQVYLPMYIIDYLKLQKRFIAIIPLVVYCCGFSATLILRIVNKYLGRKITYILGGLLICISLTIFYNVTESSLVYKVFIASAFLGFGCSVILVTSLSVTADLIGKYTETSAFVYGTMGLTDKVSNGLAIMLIQHYHPDRVYPHCPECDGYFRDAMVIVPAAAMGLGILAVILMAPFKLGRLRYCKRLEERRSHATSDERQPLLGQPPLRVNNSLPHIAATLSEEEGDR